jgi:hypothetical protein
VIRRERLRIFCTIGHVNVAAERYCKESRDRKRKRLQWGERIVLSNLYNIAAGTAMSISAESRDFALALYLLERLIDVVK